MRKLGHEVNLVAGNVSDDEIEDPVFESLDGIRLESLGRSVSLKDDLLAIIKLRKLIKELNPDVINTHTAKAGVLGRIAALGSTAKVVHTYHGHLLYGYFSPTKTKIIIFVERLLSLITDEFIAVGRQVAIDLQNVKIGSRQKYHVVHPGIPQIDFISRADARNKASVKQNAFVIGWLGRLTKIKRPDRLIDLALAMPNVDFLVGGNGELQESIRKVAPKNVQILGWVLPAEFWPACDVALLTSDNEGLPTSLIEAAFAGKAIVSENVGSAKEIFEDRVGGFLVHDSELRVQSLKKLSENPNLATKMGKSASEYATKNFSVEIFLSKHLDIYAGKSI
jgi:glycosyltransferase involved in cell wall biosynthesis